MSETVWVLDLHGYDARGGNARVFATLEAAKAALPDVVWEPWEGSGWREPDAYPGSTADVWVIYEREVEGR